ncbi:hypothetical protein GUJ93_ZPchr0008g14040 [Zizania palustris]|uniref:RBR-type E3 ubiquitin transferase n=1 Tax=Zizania palustris TaxID=103762 RepID=A0A8J5RI02_ZIZPA|nr:hypothetical protein GUJ93_ZPchr0008g14040 [Zizania palustris]
MAADDPSASDDDLAFEFLLSEAIEASLQPHDPSSSSSKAALSHPASALPESSDASCALARVKQDRRDAQAFRVFFKGMASKEVLGPRDRDPGVAILAVAIFGPQGEVVLRKQKPVMQGFVGGRMTLEVMALMEGLNAALGLGIRTLNVLTDNKTLHKHVVGIWRPTPKKLADMINRALSAKQKFEQCEISYVPQSQVSYVTKLARDSLDTQIAKAVSVNTDKKKRESFMICLEDTDVSKIHAVEGCAHRFCFSCMKEHVKMKLLHGMLPACPQDGCTTKLTVEGSKIFLSRRLSAIMAQRIREGQIPPNQKIYCPYPKCSVLMSLRELIHPMQESSSKYTVVDAATLRKCVKCRGSFCISCKVPWHDRMTCHDYKRSFSHDLPEDAYLQKLARQQLWRQCTRCKHMIELAEGCYHMTCLCGFEFCYTCGKEWKEKKATCGLSMMSGSSINNVVMLHTGLGGCQGEQPRVASPANFQRPEITLVYKRRQRAPAVPTATTTENAIPGCSSPLDKGKGVCLPGQPTLQDFVQATTAGQYMTMNIGSSQLFMGHAGNRNDQYSLIDCFLWILTPSSDY